MGPKCNQFILHWMYSMSAINSVNQVWSAFLECTPCSDKVYTLLVPYSSTGERDSSVYLGQKVAIFSWFNQLLGLVQMSHTFTTDSFIMSHAYRQGLRFAGSFSLTGERDICYSCSSVSSSGLIEPVYQPLERRLRFSHGFRDLQPRKIESPTEGSSTSIWRWLRYWSPLMSSAIYLRSPT